MHSTNALAPHGQPGEPEGSSDVELELAVHLDPDELSEQMAVDVRAGLQRTPKVLPPKYFYDGRGSELFDEITRLEEYYPTRAERAILVERADEVAAVTRAETLVELGSGTSEKTRLLLRALREAGTLTCFVPFDVDPVVLREAVPVVAGQFPGLEVAPEVGDFEQHLGDVPRRPRQLVAFLGSTIGNLDPAARAAFLVDVRDLLGDDGFLLLGTDLVKPVDRLVAAYDDARGVTAAFNRNVLRVINRSLGADFDAQAFAHRAVWDAEHEWIEMRLESTRDQRVHVRDLDLEVSFARGEAMRTEISAKFRRGGVEAELAAAGLELTHWWTDPAGDFALSLSRPLRRLVDVSSPHSDLTTVPPELSALRRSIDNIDAALIHLLAERFKATQKVGILKAHEHLPPADPGREEEQIQRLRLLAEDSGLDPVFAEKFLAFVVEEVIRHHTAIADATRE